MKKLLALLLAVIMTFALVACAQTGDQSPDGDKTAEEMKYGGHLNIASININGNLDPCNTGGVSHWANLVWESPLSKNADGSFAPGVCNFELSDDQLTLKLWVREGVTFHDGSAVEIEDVVASVKRRGHLSSSQFLVDFTESIIVENGVATMKFKKYDNKTMIILTGTLVAVLPKEFCEKYPGVGDGTGVPVHNVEVADAIGTGPYKIDSERDGEWLKLVRYDNYKKADASLTGPAAPKNAYLDSITFWNISDNTSAIIQLLANDIDVLSLDVGDYKNQLETNNLAQTKALGDKVRIVQFNTLNQENVVHDDVNLRKAICAAIDFVELNEGMWGGLYDLNGSPCTESIYAIDTFAKADYMGKANVELARQYLAKSNYKGEPIYYVDNDANNAAIIKAYLEKAGINLDVHIKESISEINKGKNNWNFFIKNYSTGEIPSTISATLFNRCWVSAEKDRLFALLGSGVPASEEYMAAWKDLTKVWVDDCASPYVGSLLSEWTHHKDLVIEYDGYIPQLWKWYWKNPAEHAEK